MSSCAGLFGLGTDGNRSCIWLSSFPELERAGQQARHSTARDQVRSELHASSEASGQWNSEHKYSTQHFLLLLLQAGFSLSLPLSSSESLSSMAIGWTLSAAIFNSAFNTASSARNFSQGTLCKATLVRVPDRPMIMLLSFFACRGSMFAPVTGSVEMIRIVMLKMPFSVGTVRGCTKLVVGD